MKIEEEKIVVEREEIAAGTAEEGYIKTIQNIEAKKVPALIQKAAAE